MHGCGRRLSHPDYLIPPHLCLHHTQAGQTGSNGHKARGLDAKHCPTPHSFSGFSSEKDLKNEFHISYKGLGRGDGGVIHPLPHRPARQTPYQTLSVSHVHTLLPVVHPLLHRPA